MERTKRNCIKQYDQACAQASTRGVVSNACEYRSTWRKANTWYAKRKAAGNRLPPTSIKIEIQSSRSNRAVESVAPAQVFDHSAPEPRPVSIRNKGASYESGKN